MSEIIQTFIYDFDDFALDKPGYDLLVKIKEHYPNFKCTCFTPAFNMNVFLKKVSTDRFKTWGKIVKDIDWIEIAPHGFSHLKGECLTDRKQFTTMILAIENLFKYLELPYVKIFKAPHWEISEEAEKVLKERGYILAIDRNNPVVRVEMPTYVWNWSIDEPMPKYPLIKAHGHVWLTNNGLDKCLPNILRMPQNAEFKTVGEYLGLQTINN